MIKKSYYHHRLLPRAASAERASRYSEYFDILAVKRGPRSRERRLGRASGSTASDKFGSICTRKMSTSGVEGDLQWPCHGVPQPWVSLKTRDPHQKQVHRSRRNCGKSNDLRGEGKKRLIAAAVESLCKMLGRSWSLDHHRLSGIYLFHLMTGSRGNRRPTEAILGTTDIDA